MEPGYYHTMCSVVCMYLQLSVLCRTLTEIEWSRRDKRILSALVGRRILGKDLLQLELLRRARKRQFRVLYPTSRTRRVEMRFNFSLVPPN